MWRMVEQVHLSPEDIQVLLQRTYANAAMEGNLVAMDLIMTTPGEFGQQEIHNAKEGSNNEDDEDAEMGNSEKGDEDFDHHAAPAA